MGLAHPLIGSRWELEQYSRSRVAGAFYGNNRMLCRLLGDYLVFVDTRDFMCGPRLVLDGFWEAWVTLALGRYVQPGFHCVDVGANYGYYTLLMAAACERGGRVMACEPNPLLAKTYLADNVALNGCREQVEICPKAIGDVDAEAVDFVLHEGDYATSSLARWAYSHRSKSIHVPATTLDTALHDWERLDLVKIDAEGAEALVWDGMQQTLGRFPHVAVAVELHLQRDPPQVRSLLQRIEQDGYALRYLNYDGDVTAIDAATILANPQEHWMLWLQR